VTKRVFFQEVILTTFIPGRGYATTARVRQVWRTDNATTERDRGEFPLPLVENADVAYGAMPALPDDSYDWRWQAMLRREKRIAEANRPPGPLQAIAQEVVDKVGEATKKVAKVSKLEQAMTWLREALNAGPQTQKTVEAMARKADINPRTLKRAKERLRVQSIRKGRQSWIWALTRAEPEAGQKR
jgi:DNA repair ATPase RecN